MLIHAYMTQQTNLSQVSCWEWVSDSIKCWAKVQQIQRDGHHFHTQKKAGPKKSVVVNILPLSGLEKVRGFISEKGIVIHQVMNHQ